MNARLLLAVPAMLAASSLALAAETPPRQPPQSSRAAPQTASRVQEHTLPNGMKVLLLEDHAAPVATFSVFYKVGSRNETTGNTGAAHLLEHMMFKGTGRLKKGEIMATLDRIGAEWNATTFYDYTNYYETVSIDRLDQVMGLEAERMRGSLIRDDERDLERIVVRNELERGESSPVRSLMQEVWAAAFKAHPYHHPVIGWRSDVEGVPTAKLREIYRSFYQPDNAVAVLVGDFEASAALAMVRKHFGKLPGGHSFPAVYTEEPEQKGERRVLIRKPGDMKVVALGWKTPPAAHPDTVPLKLLHLILTGELDLGPFGDPLDPGISNRLYQALVEKELATYGGADYVPLKDAGLFMVLALPRPEVEHEKVEQAIRAQLERLKTEPVGAEELARAKARATAAYGLLQDGTSGRAMLLGYFAAIADWKLAESFADRIQAVTSEDLMRVARAYFDDSKATTGWFVPTTAGSGEAASLGEARTRPEAYRGFDGLSARSADMATAAAPSRRAIRATEPVHRTVLPNGLVLLVRENHANPTFSIAGSVKAGGFFDPKDEPLLADLTASALMLGSARRSKLEIARALEDVGASLGYSGGSEVVSLSARGLSRDLDRVLDLLTETLMTPAFPDGEVQKLKREAIASLKQEEDSPSTRAHRAFMQGLYPKGHPYFVPSLEETIAAVEAVDPKALRDFHAARYGANATTLAIVGDVDAQSVVEAVERRLGSMKRVAAPELAIPPTPVRTEPLRQVVFVADKPNVDVMLGHQGVIARADADYYPAMIANFVFGGSASARLFQQVRDRMGLTYGIYSSLSAAHGAGPWSVWMTLNPGNVEKASAEVKRMARELVEKGLTEAEIASAKQTLAGKYKVGLATNAGMAQVLAFFEGYGFPPEQVDLHPRLIEAVSRAQISSVLQRCFHPESLLEVIAGTWPPEGAAKPAEKPADQ